MLPSANPPLAAGPDARPGRGGDAVAGNPQYCRVRCRTLYAALLSADVQPALHSVVCIVVLCMLGPLCFVVVDALNSVSNADASQMMYQNADQHAELEMAHSS